MKELPGNKERQMTFQYQYSRNLFLPIMKKKKFFFNNWIRISTFPEIIRKAEVTPASKKGDPISKTDYHPISALSNFSKFLRNSLFAIK